MNTRAQRSPPPPPPSTHVGELLRQWRSARRLSQLDLALEADVSCRHLSYVETGKSQPSHDMLARLADALTMPLRERNALMMAAGYAPKYRETSLSAPELAPVRRAIELILEHHEPYPAFVMTRHWDVIMSNHSLRRLVVGLRGRAPLHDNLMRQVFDPNDIRPLVANWEDVAGDLIRHLHNEVAASPSDEKTRRLLDEVLAYPDIPARWRTREPGATPLPLPTTEFRKGDLVLRFFSTFTTFGTSRDVTVDEIRIESMFPADEASAEFCRKLSAGGLAKAG